MSLFRFSADSVKVSAALANGRYLTPTESRDIFGSEISGKYYNGSEYVDCTFTYNTTATLYGVNTAGLTGDYLNANSTYLIYTAQFTANTAVQYITVEVQPTYSIFDTTQIHSCIALSAGTSNASSPATPSSTFQSPSWDWIIGGSSVHLENSDTISGGGKKAGIDFKINSVHTWFSFVQLDFTSQSSISGYSLAADFYGNSAVGGKYYLAIGCPYVDSSSTASNGTFTTAPAGGGDINVLVTVDVDLSDTNSKIDGIAGAVQAVKDLLEGDSSDYPPLTSLIPLGTYPMTFDSNVVDDGLQALDDVPDELAAGGFWFKLSYDLLHLSPLWLLLPLLMALALARYVIWRG